MKIYEALFAILVVGMLVFLSVIIRVESATKKEEAKVQKLQEENEALQRRNEAMRKLIDVIEDMDKKHPPHFHFNVKDACEQ